MSQVSKKELGGSWKGVVRELEGLTMLFAVVDEVSLRAELVGKLTGPESFFEASLLSDWLWIVEHSVVFLTVRRSFWKLLMIND